jgi:cell division septation protein DedD
MIDRLRSLILAILGVSALAGAVAAQTASPVSPSGPVPEQAASNPVCVRFESQLAALDRGAADPVRADQVKRYDDSIAKQQTELDRTLAQSRKLGCEGGGFFALFSGRAPQCQPLYAQIQQMRDNLDRMMSDLERIKSGSTTDQAGQRAALIQELAQNNCGPQYRAAAASAGPGGFLQSLFGGTIISQGGDGAPAGTYRTVCVRTCDGYYFPISYSTVPNRFADDQRSCQRECPASEAVLYSYRNPGEDMNQAVSLNGQPYTELPNAFRYRKEFAGAACSCRRPGQTWADALKNADDASTLEAGDIVVTDQNSKALSQAPQQKVKQQPKNAASQKDASAVPATPNPAPATADASTSNSGGVRTVGPPFVAGH